MLVEEIVFDVFELSLSENNSVKDFFSKLLLIRVLFTRYRISKLSMFCRKNNNNSSWLQGYENTTQKDTWQMKFI